MVTVSRGRDRRGRFRTASLVLGGIAIVYTIGFLTPLMLMVSLSIGHGGIRGLNGHLAWWGSYRELWASSYYRGIIGHSVLLGLAAVAITLALGIPLAHHVVHGSTVLRGLILVAVLNPLFVNVIIRSFGVKILFEYLGMGQSWGLVLVGTVQIVLPFMVLPLIDATRAIDPALGQAARGLGARPLRVAYRIVLPNLLPGILAGSALVFVIGMNMFSIPLVLGRPQDPTLALVVYQTAIADGDFRFAAAGGISLLAVTLLGMILLARAQRRLSLV